MYELRFTDDPRVDRTALVDLYESVGWTVYSDDPPALDKALRGSDFVTTAWSSERLVGLVRCISDDVSIVYVQDLLVDPSHRRQGVGAKLMEACLVRYSHVRQKVLLCDGTDAQRAFYGAQGFRDVTTLEPIPLAAFFHG